MKRHPVLVGLATYAAAFFARPELYFPAEAQEGVGIVAETSPAAAGSSAESQTRYFDVEDIARGYRVAPLPNMVGRADLVLNGYGLVDLVARPEDLPWIGRPRWVTQSREETDAVVPPESVLGEPEICEVLWQCFGHRECDCQFFGSKLCLSASPEVLDASEELLGALRREARARISIDGLLVPEAVLESIAPAWASEGPVLPESVFDKALLDKRARLLCAVARSGERLTIGSRDVAAMIPDVDANPTGVLPVLEPVTDYPPTGDYLMLRPILLPKGERVWLDVVTGRIHVQSQEKSVGAHWGDLDFPLTHKIWISTACVVEPGKALVVGYIGGEKGLVALVRVRVDRPVAGIPEVPRERSQKGPRNSISTQDLTLFFEPVGRLWPGFPRDLPPERDPRSAWPEMGIGGFWKDVPRFEGDQDALRDLLREDLRAAGIDAKILLRGNRLFAAGVRAEEFEDFCSRVLSRLTGLYAVNVSVWKVPREQFAALLRSAGGGRVLEAGWEKALEGVCAERFAAAVAARQPVGFLCGAFKNFPVGVRQVVGGAGRMLVQVSDPEIRSCGDGTELWFQAAPASDASLVRVLLAGLSARIMEERAAIRVFHPWGSGPEESSKEEPRGAGPIGVEKVVALRAEKARLEFPHQDVRFWHAEAEIPLVQRAREKYPNSIGARCTLEGVQACTPSRVAASPAGAGGAPPASPPGGAHAGPSRPPRRVQLAGAPNLTTNF